jgi:hypothetical protein
MVGLLLGDRMPFGEPLKKANGLVGRGFSRDMNALFL